MVLNLINQGPAIVDLRLGHVVWWRVALTFLVPFCVSVYSSARSGMRSGEVR